MSDNEWIYDFLIAYLKSPPWRVPLNNFIDEHCVKFSDEEENKLEYTIIHKDFCNMIDNLLGGYLQELGLNDQDFLAAVQASSTENDKVNKLIFGQILAVDNFMTFKRMMIRRNKALEVKAMKMALNPGNTSAKSSTGGTSMDDDVDVSQMSEKEQLRLALKLSAELAQGVNSSQKLNADQLEAVIKASATEAELRKADQEREQAELEHAIALSLALEEERLKKLEAAEHVEKTSNNPEEVAHARKIIQEVLVEEAQIMQQEAVEEIEAKIEECKLTGAPAPKLPSLPPVPTVANPPPPDSLPSIAMVKERHAAHVAKVQDEFKQAELRKLRKKEKKKKAAQEAGVNDDELARRAEFLKAQRDIIKQKRQQQREAELAEFQHEAKHSAAPIPPPAAHSSQGPVAVEEIKEQGGSSEDEKQQAMRRALAQRFKADMQLRKAKINAENQDKYYSLSQQLRQAEQLRQKMEEDNEQDMVHQERERREKLAAFHANLKASAGR